MNHLSLPVRALLNALGVGLYVALIATFFANVERIFDGAEPEGITAPLAMLLLFVFSALLTATIVLLPPIRLYLDGQKTEGVKLLLFTAMWLGIITLLAMLFLIIT